MKINNANELNLFEKALPKCKHPVLLQTREGEIYNLRTDEGHTLGIKELCKKMKPWLAPEVFTTTQEDQCFILDFLMKCPAAA